MRPSPADSNKLQRKLTLFLETFRWWMLYHPRPRPSLDRESQIESSYCKWINLSLNFSSKLQSNSITSSDRVICAQILFGRDGHSNGDHLISSIYEIFTKVSKAVRIPNWAWYDGSIECHRTTDKLNIHYNHQIWMIKHILTTGEQCAIQTVSNSLTYRNDAGSIQLRALVALFYPIERSYRIMRFTLNNSNAFGRWKCSKEKRRKLITW